MLNSAYINLSLLKENALKIREKLPSGVKFCAVVKADGYGHGAQKVASTLYPIVDCFAVALVEEGIALRRSGIDKQILVLIPPFLEDIEVAVAYSLTLAVESAEQLLALNEEGKRQGRKVKVHLKFDTGMKRLGVSSLAELEGLLELAKGLSNVEVDGMFSHFACPENKKARKSAQNKFLLANNLVKRYNKRAICHICASGGFLTGVVGDMVRIGILLYGYKPFESDLIKVNPIMKVVAPVVNTRRLKKGEGALYGLKKAERTLPLALVRVGYADGFSRENTEEIFSNRCMDLTLYKGEKKIGEKVVILESAEKIARAHGTISYEVLVNATVRAERIYID